MGGLKNPPKHAYVIFEWSSPMYSFCSLIFSRFVNIFSIRRHSCLSNHYEFSIFLHELKPKCSFRNDFFWGNSLFSPSLTFKPQYLNWRVAIRKCIVWLWSQTLRRELDRTLFLNQDVSLKYLHGSVGYLHFCILHNLQNCVLCFFAKNHPKEQIERKNVWRIWQYRLWSLNLVITKSNKLLPKSTKNWNWKSRVSIFWDVSIKAFSKK